MKIPSDIMNINELIENIENGEYIDCDKYSGYTDDNEYESIMFYLNWCKNWFIIQNIDKLGENNER